MTEHPLGAGKVSASRYSVLGSLILVVSALPAFAQPDPALGRAQLIPAAVQGCEALSVSFRSDLKYVSHMVSEDGLTLTIRLSRGTALRSEDLSADLIETAPPVSFGAGGMITVSLDNSHTDPLLILRFPQPVHPAVQQIGARAILITGIGELSADFCGALSGSDTQIADILPDVGDSDSAKIEALFSEARSAITAGNYDRAIQLLTKLVSLKEHSRSAEAQELLGLARERNGQLAHARAEYEIYLEKYPDNPGAARVRQRLAGVITAQASPQQQLRTAEAGTAATPAEGAQGQAAQPQPEAGGAAAPPRRRSARPAPAPKPKPEEPSISGVFTSYYYSNQGSTLLTEFATNTSSTDNQVFQNALVFSIDVEGHKKADGYTLDWRLQADEDLDFASGGATSFGLSRAYGELSFPQSPFKLKFGRQKLNSSGVFGRFDGALLSWTPNERITTRAVLGAPVNSTKDPLFGTGKRLVGLSMDINDLRPDLDGSIYAVKQSEGGYLDRQAIGFEGQYLTDTASAYGLVDYDTSFGKLNTARLSGTLIFPDQSSVSASLDYSNSPTLTLGNALIGQSATSLQQLNATYTLDQMRQLAQDRTTRTTSLTVAYSRPLNDTWQLSLDTTLFNTGGNPASGGVAAVPAPGLEVYASAQMVGSNVFRDGDTVSASARIANTSSSSLLLLDSYTRFSWNENLRLKPRLKLGRRNVKSSGSTEIFAIPSVSADYQLNDRMSFELEVGGRVSNLSAPSFSQESNEAFATAGFSLEF